MKTKSEYSRINFPLLRKTEKEWKKSKKGIHINEYIQSKFVKNDLEKNQKYYITTFFILDKENIVNYFISSCDLEKFLKENDYRNNPFENISKIIEEHNKRIKFSKAFKSHNFFAGRIFTKKLQKCVHFLITKGQYNEILITDGDKILSFNKDLFCNYKKNEISDYEKNLLNLVLNTISYLQAYPENILDQPPDERIEDKVDPKNTKTITVSKEISDYLKDTELTPHLRRGHFRLLNSDYYKHKKGQVIFIRSSFVKGKAKTIIDNEVIK